MLCPECSQHPLQCHASIASYSRDNTRRHTSQWWRCRGCETCYYAVLTEWMDDAWMEHIGYRVDPRRWKRTAPIARACPAPHDGDCRCDAHSQFATPWFGGTAPRVWHHSHREGGLVERSTRK